MLRFLGLGGAREKVSHVTVSRAWGGKGKGVTCYGFWWSGGIREKVSRVTVSVVWGEKREKVSHVTVSGPWGGLGKRCHMLRFLGLG